MYKMQIKYYKAHKEADKAEAEQKRVQQEGNTKNDVLVKLANKASNLRKEANVCDQQYRNAIKEMQQFQATYEESMKRVMEVSDRLRFIGMLMDQ